MWLNRSLNVNQRFHFKIHIHITDTVKELEITTFRLPNNTRPLIYEIRINTSIHRGEFFFDGQARITISVQETSRNITLHARQLLILDINLRYLDDSIFDSNLRFTYDSATDFLTIFTDRELEGGTLFLLDIEYVGFLGDFNNRGFFRSSYIDSNTNETHWIASTQFQVRFVIIFYIFVQLKNPRFCISAN